MSRLEPAFQVSDQHRDAAPTAAVATRDLAVTLRRAGVPTPELDARLLACAACGLTHEGLIAHPKRVLSGQENATLMAFAARRESREPVSRILGRREFWGRDFGISASTLDPRPDSETLIAAVLDLVDATTGRQARLRLLDAGTGSGCLLLTLLAELPNAVGLGLDVDEGALHMAARNAKALGLDGRARFIGSMWLAAIEGLFDVVVANPPYLATQDIDCLAPEVAHFEPRVALDGGPDGLAAYRAIVPELPRVLAPGSIVAIEIGDGQADMVTHLIAEAGLGIACRVRAWPDLSGTVRCLTVGRSAREESGCKKEVGN